MLICSDYIVSLNNDKLEVIVVALDNACNVNLACWQCVGSKLGVTARVDEHRTWILVEVARSVPCRRHVGLIRIKIEVSGLASEFETYVVESSNLTCSSLNVPRTVKCSICILILLSLVHAEQFEMLVPDCWVHTAHVSLAVRSRRLA